MKPRSIIKTVLDKRHYEDVRISAIEGRRYAKKPTYYRNTLSGEDYYSIVGAIAFPISRTPGFALVVGAMKETKYENAPCLRVLAEIEDHDLVGLLTQCESIRHIWGYPDILDLWIGDPEMYMQVFSDFNDRIETNTLDSPEGLYLSHPFDYEHNRRDAIYLQTVKSLLSPAMGVGKRLIIGDNRLLRANLQNVPPDVKRVQELPALAALAYACHTLLGISPWLEFIKPERYSPTIKDGYEHFAPWPWEDLDPWDWAEDEMNDDDMGDDGLTDTIL